MEKDVAVREWCLEKAIQCTNTLGTKEILTRARDFEDYVTGDKRIEFRYFCGHCDKEIDSITITN